MSAPAIDPARDRLALLIRQHGDDMAGLSRIIGRPADYLGAYLRRGAPKRLPDQERGMLADYYGMHADDPLPYRSCGGRMSGRHRA